MHFHNTSIQLGVISINHMEISCVSLEIYTVQAFTTDIVFVGIKKSSRNRKMTSLGFITLTGRSYFLRKFSHPHTYAGITIGF